MATVSSATPGSLQVLREPNSQSEDGVDIVLVPGAGSIPPEQWPFANQDWLATLPSDLGDGARVLAYEYSSPFTATNPSWESFLMLGYDLLQHLSDRDVSSPGRTAPRPVLIVCHSLGGVIVKQALCVANKQFPRYGEVVNAIAGVVFLSTPHRYGDKSATFGRFRDVLEATTRKSLKIPATNVEQEGAMLLDLADRFEAILFRTPVLSVFELKESKHGTATLRPRYQQLVSREVCSIHAPMETVIGLNLNHYEMCLFTRSLGGEGLPELTKFIHDAMRDAPQLVAVRLEDEEYQYATMSAYSPTMSEVPLKKMEDLDLAEWPSNFATDGPSNRATDGTSLSGFEIVPPSNINFEARKTVNLPCFVLGAHSANRDFCGREDILELLASELLPPQNSVTASGTTLRQFALCGFGGIGKTEIAREFARRHKGSFDAIFWVTADEIAKLDHHYQQISLALGLEDPAECKSQVVSREIVKGWLSNPRKELSGSGLQSGDAEAEATWLLIFDNADNPMNLADYWPQGSGSILITSRDPLAKNMFTRRPSGLDLGPLSEQDGLSLLNHLATNLDEPEDDTAQKITVALGGVPLAISQMAGIIRRQDLTLSEFFELYTDQEEHASLYETKFDTNLVTYRHSLSTVWAFEKLKPNARHLLELISFLDPDVIGEDLLMEASVELLSDGAHFRKSNYIEARADLLQSSLVQRDKHKQQVSVHRIVQDAIFTTMDGSRKQFMFDLVVRSLWAEWPSAMPKPSKEPDLPQPKSTGGRLNVGRWPACAVIYPHVLRTHQVWSTIPNISEATRLLLAKLLTEAAWYQKERGRRKDLDGFFETARIICESSTHPDRDAILADIYFCLGSVAMDSNNFNTSRVYKEQSLELVSKICKELGVEDERLSFAYLELGIARTQDGRYEEGEAAFKTGLRIQRALGDHLPRSREANLSYALMGQGKLDECNTLLLDSLAGREKVLGKDDTESARTGLILYALGNLRAVQGRWDESLEFHQRAWRHMRRTVGDRDLYTAIVVHKIAMHLFRLGKTEEAITMTNTALDIWSVEPDAHKNEIARTTFLKGKIFEASGKGQKASIALRVASRLRREITKEERDVRSLTMEDFDKLVAFWSR
ncbi:hypothetical protein QBC47DRAFT_391863 [Echria macrotheca]|uniref:Tetratricopeptide repeat domain-containing protein n=1 Tax=Echria macrotheca TaxID=438768 RepID=A0AAJ0B4L4_9PEZI|nr:hypothetical protein QBC47DRAFT_391863 [Echria macrotheca]